MKLIIAIATAVLLFSCQKEEKFCQCHKEIWRLNQQHEWVKVWSDSTMTYLDFCANDGEEFYNLDNTKHVVKCP